MDNKDLITRFAEDCFRFEALHQEIDGLIAEADSEVLAYEYEDLANQAAEIVLKLSANGNNVGENFYRYYVERLEYIIDYFRALLDYEETPLAEDEQDELDDEPGAVHFEGFPAGCAFPKSTPFVLKKWAFTVTPTAKDKWFAAADEAGAVEETADEDTPPTELDNENDAQAAESDEAADDTAAGTPVSEADILLPPYVGAITGRAYSCWEKLTSKQRAEVRETFAMWGEMNDITGRNSGGDDYAEAVKELDGAEWWFFHAKSLLIDGFPKSLVRNESSLRKRINRAIDAIPGFRESEKLKKLIELYPTYKERLQ